MMIKFLKINFLVVLFASCNAEKVSLSPMGNVLLENQFQVNNFNDLTRNRDLYFHIAEMTNLLSSFPSVENKKINDQIGILKFNLKEYAYATKAQNIIGRKRALKSIEKCYRKIQNSRKSLNEKDNKIINRHLVRIKSHITKLEELQNT